MMCRTQQFSPIWITLSTSHSKLKGTLPKQTKLKTRCNAMASATMTAGQQD